MHQSPHSPRSPQSPRGFQSKRRKFDYEECENDEINTLIVQGCLQHLSLRKSGRPETRGMQTLLLCSMLNRRLHAVAKTEVRRLLDDLNQVKDTFLADALNCELRAVEFVRLALPDSPKLILFGSDKLATEIEAREERNEWGVRAPLTLHGLAVRFKTAMLRRVASEKMYNEKLKTLFYHGRDDWHLLYHLPALGRVAPTGILAVLNGRKLHINIATLNTTIQDVYEMFKSFRFTQPFVAAVTFDICQMCAGIGRRCVLDASTGPSNPGCRPGVDGLVAQNKCCNFSAYQNGIFLMANHRCVCEQVFSEDCDTYQQNTQLIGKAQEMLAAAGIFKESLVRGSSVHLRENREAANNLKRAQIVLGNNDLIPGILIDYNRFLPNDCSLRGRLRLTERDYAFAMQQHTLNAEEELAEMQQIWKARMEKYNKDVEAVCQQYAGCTVDELNKMLPGFSSTVNKAIRETDAVFSQKMTIGEWTGVGSRIKSVMLLKGTASPSDTPRAVLHGALFGAHPMRCKDSMMFGPAGVASPDAYAYFFGFDLSMLSGLEGHPMSTQLRIRAPMRSSSLPWTDEARVETWFNSKEMNSFILFVHIFDNMTSWDVVTRFHWHNRVHGGDPAATTWEDLRIQVHLNAPSGKRVILPVCSDHFQSRDSWHFYHMVFYGMLKHAAKMSIEGAATVTSVMEDNAPAASVWYAAPAAGGDDAAAKEINDYFHSVLQTMNLFPNLRGLLFWFVGIDPKRVHDYVIGGLVGCETRTLGEHQIHSLLDSLQLVQDSDEE